MFYPIVTVSSPSSTITKGKKKDKKGKKLTKEDISTPSDFRHVGHIGWDPASGFDVSNPTFTMHVSVSLLSVLCMMYDCR